MIIVKVNDIMAFHTKFVSCATFATAVATKHILQYNLSGIITTGTGKHVINTIEFSGLLANAREVYFCQE
jgi:hypothetical protein